MNPPPIATTATKPLRWGFITIFGVSALSQIIIAIMSIRDGYFPTPDMLERFPDPASRYWVTNRFVMPTFLLTAIVSVIAAKDLSKRNWSERVFWLGLLACVLTWIPFQFYCVIPVMIWIFTRRSYCRSSLSVSADDHVQPAQDKDLRNKIAVE